MEYICTFLKQTADRRQDVTEFVQFRRKLFTKFQKTVFHLLYSTVQIVKNLLIKLQKDKYIIIFLQALNFNLDGKLSLSDLTMALENELLVTKNGIHQAALASFKAEIRHLL